MLRSFESALTQFMGTYCKTTQQRLVAREVLEFLHQYAYSEAAEISQFPEHGANWYLALYRLHLIFILTPLHCFLGTFAESGNIHIRIVANAQLGQNIPSRDCIAIMRTAARKFARRHLQTPEACIQDMRGVTEHPGVRDAEVKWNESGIRVTFVATVRQWEKLFYGNMIAPLR